MNSSTYNSLVYLLLGGSLVALVAATAYLTAAIIGWRGPHRRRRLVWCAAFTVLCPTLVAAQQALLFWVFLPSFGREQQQARAQRVDAVSVVRVGDKAPPFRVMTADGAEVILDELRGKVVLLNFFATWCGPCIRELPHVQELWDANRGRGDFALLVIGRDETSESVKGFRMKHGYTFPIAADPERSVYSLYADELIPRTYLLSRDGTICFAATGFDEEAIPKLKEELATQLRR